MKFLLCAAAAAAIAGAALATPLDAVRAFGGPPLGAKWTRMPAHVRPGPNCEVTVKFIDCEFAAPGGLHYLVYGQEITRKEVRRIASGTKWPFGLTGRETPATLKAKLAARYGLKFIPDVVGENSALVLTAPTTGSRTADSLFFTFTKAGRLMEVTLWVETPED